MINKTFFRLSLTVAIAALAFSSCSKKKDDPIPVEQELITTVILHCTKDGTTTSFTYKVENGFNNTTPGTVQIDTLKLTPGATYTTSIEVLNEKGATVADQQVTNEIKSENTAHLFLYISTPPTGAGSLSFANGNKDDNGNPFNLTGSLTTSTAGKGSLRIYLMHQPTNKAGTTPDATGGETDIDVTYPVVIQ